MFRWCSSSAFQAGCSVSRPVPTVVTVPMVMGCFLQSSIVTPHDGSFARAGGRRLDAFSHMRKPPVNAKALLPARQPFGSFFSFFDVPSPEDHVVGMDRLDHPRRPELDVLLPFLPAQLLQGPGAEVVLVRAVLE